MPESFVNPAAKHRAVANAVVYSRSPDSKKNGQPSLGRPSSLSYATVLALLGLGFGISVGLPLVDGTSTEFHGPGGPAMFFGSLTGLAGTYLALVMVILAARLPALERMVGQGWVMHWHRRLAPYPIALILIHTVLLSFAYAAAAKTGVLHEFSTIVATFPQMITATIAFGLMMLVGIVSIRQIRQYIKRESWWLLHLTLYVALIISFAHEIVLGPSFVKHPLTQLLWSAAWILAAVLILTYRVLVPLYRTLLYQLEVEEIRPEGPGVISIICKGKHLEQLRVAGGQFFEWRFLAPGLWWQAHPFTVSAKPTPPTLRLTVKEVGDFSRALATIPIGTKIAIEGPYGSFTTHHRLRDRSLLIAGGIGVTAVRPLLEDLPKKAKPVVIVRASSATELTLREEIERLALEKGGSVHYLIGPRSKVSLDAIGKLVPDIKKRDVFLCGSEEFVGAVTSALHALKVEPGSIHHEAYSL
jgi:predicted ferric reductase